MMRSSPSAGRDLLPVAVLLGDKHAAAEAVGVRHNHRTFGAVYLNVIVLVLPDIEARRDVDEGAGRKFNDAGDVGRDVDRDLFTGTRAAADRAVIVGAAHGAGDLADRAEHIYQRGQVIRSHVEHRSAARLVVKIGIRVPALMPRQHDMGRTSDRISDAALVQ